MKNASTHEAFEERTRKRVGRTIRLLEPAWEAIEAAAKSVRRPPLEFLRMHIEDEFLGRPRRAA